MHKSYYFSSPQKWNFAETDYNNYKLFLQLNMFLNNILRVFFVTKKSCPRTKLQKTHTFWTYFFIWLRLRIHEKSIRHVYAAARNCHSSLETQRRPLVPHDLTRIIYCPLWEIARLTSPTRLLCIIKAEWKVHFHFFQRLRRKKRSIPRYFRNSRKLHHQEETIKSVFPGRYSRERKFIKLCLFRVATIVGC